MFVISADITIHISYWVEVAVEIKYRK